MVYAYRWGRALVRSSGTWLEDDRHPHAINDFISSLQRNIRNKITNKWADLKNPPFNVQEAFDLTIRTETQIQVADSFKSLLTTLHQLTLMKLVLTIALTKGKKWNDNNYRKGGYRSN